MMKNAKNMMNRMISVIAAAIMMATMTVMNVSGADEEEIAAMTEKLAIMINEAREAEGLAPIYVVPEVNEAAQIRAEESIYETMARGRKMAGGIEDIIDEEIIPYDYAAEVLAAGTSTAEETLACWKNSEDHWAALMAADITHIGVGAVYEEDSIYGYYWQVTVIRTNAEFADQYIAGEEEIAEMTEGDINGDGYVDTYDYIALTNYLFNSNTKKETTTLNLETADCFRDGIITKADAKVLAQYILGECKSLPVIA